MPKYVGLSTWTEQGIAALADTTRRAEQVREVAARMGCRLEALYWTQGRYDLVSIVDAPDDETAAALTLRIVGRGAVRTETLRAFDATEMDAVVARLA